MRTRRRVHWAQFRVVCVTFVALLILGTVLYLVTGGSLFTEQTKLYVYIPDATGLIQTSPVRVNGITVGKVDRISLSGSKEPTRVVKLTLAVARDSLASIPTGSYAELSTDDPAGDKFVDITSRGRGELTPGSEIPYHGPSDVFKTLDMAQFETNLRQMDAILTDIETGRSRVGQFVLGTQMYTDLRRRIGDIERSLHAAAATDTAVAQELYTDRFYRKLMAPVAEFDRAIARLQSGQGAGRLLRDAADYDQAAAAIRSLHDTITSLRASPMIASDELYTEWNRWAVSLARSVDQFNAGPTFAPPQEYESWTGWARDLENTLRDFRGNPRKYMRLKVF